MYGLVLMTAMSTTPSTPEFNGYFRDLFFGNCSGCSGYTAPRYNCGGAYYPAGCSGSYYAGCNGCNGDTFMNRVRRWFDSWGCCGGIAAGYGCSGSRYGCAGTAAYSCFGSAAAYSCFGGPAVSYTPVVNGGQSCYGGPTPSAPPPIFDPYPTTPLVPGMGPAPTIPYAPPEPAPGTNLNTGLKPAGHAPALVSNSAADGARAIVVVRLPADAQLFAEGRELGLSGAERKFASPALPPNQEFTYRFRVEYERDGETISVTKKVPVRAGGTATLEFTDLTAKSPPERAPKIGAGAVAAVPAAMPAAKSAQVEAVSPANAPSQPAATAPAMDRATITVKLPPGATLYVDDRRSPSTNAVRQFSTPPLPQGRDFAYLMKMEIVRNGQPETFTQKVPFRAGERVEVDFSSVGR
jgi:uncharacterized protein (TIGR03000 family)